jgi:NAD-dependent deacetylase
MTHIIVPGTEESKLPAAVEAFRRARSIAALTGAGISVESGIPDFRSNGGLWSEFPPDEYATLDVFYRNPAKAWRLYRALGRKLEGKQPNAAHQALARLEESGRLDVVITQNVDGLHQAAGSRNVIEVHGDHSHLQCVRCGWLGPVLPEHHDEAAGVPSCPDCNQAVKPNVVLFGEDARGMGEATPALHGCDLLLVIGTSAQVYPAAALPAIVKERGGLIFEFNLEETALTRGTVGGNWLGLILPGGAGGTRSDYLFRGGAGQTLSRFAEAVLA